MKMTIDMAQTPPFTVIAMKPSYQFYGLKEQIKDYCRATYAKPKADVELKLSKWANQLYDKQGNLVQRNADGSLPAGVTTAAQQIQASAAAPAYGGGGGKKKKKFGGSGGSGGGNNNGGGNYGGNSGQQNSGQNNQQGSNQNQQRQNNSGQNSN